MKFFTTLCAIGLLSTEVNASDIPALTFSAPLVTPEYLFETLILTQKCTSNDGRSWELVTGSIGNARGQNFTVSSINSPPLTKISSDQEIIGMPFKVDLTPYIGQYIIFYRLDGQYDTHGYFALVTPDESFYKTPLSTMRFSAEFDSALWPKEIDEISFHYIDSTSVVHDIGSVTALTPDIKGRRSVNEAFANPPTSYINPSNITCAIHYIDKPHVNTQLNPYEFHSKYLVDLSTATPSTLVPHATRFIINFAKTSDGIKPDISYRGRFNCKAKICEPTGKVYSQPEIGSAEHDTYILDSLYLKSSQSTYIVKKEDAKSDPEYPFFLDVAQTYFFEGAKKHKRPIHLVSTLRMLRSNGYLPSSAYVAQILIDIRKSLNLSEKEEFYPYNPS